MKEQLGRVLVPVLLGDGLQPLKIARNLYKRYGVLSHIYCSHPGFWAHFFTYVRIVRMPAYLQGELLYDDLCSFSKEYPDLMFCLIPCTEEYKVFCSAHADLLESYYVIVHPEQLQKNTLPYLSKEELPV